MKVHEGSLNLGEVQQWPKTCSMMFRGFREWILLDKLNRALQNLENHKVLLKNPVRPNEGPWLLVDPVGGSACVPRVPWYDFSCLECRNMAYIPDFHLWAIWPPRMIKDFETPVWLGLKVILVLNFFLGQAEHQQKKWQKKVPLCHCQLTAQSMDTNCNAAICAIHFN